MKKQGRIRGAVWPAIVCGLVLMAFHPDNLSADDEKADKEKTERVGQKFLSLFKKKEPANAGSESSEEQAPEKEASASQPPEKKTAARNGGRFFHRTRRGRAPVYTRAKTDSIQKNSDSTEMADAADDEADKPDPKPSPSAEKKMVLSEPEKEKKINPEPDSKPEDDPDPESSELADTPKPDSASETEIPGKPAPEEMPRAARPESKPVAGTTAASEKDPIKTPATQPGKPSEKPEKELWLPSFGVYGDDSRQAPKSTGEASASIIADKPRDSKPETTPASTTIGAVEEKTAKVMPETAPVSETAAAASAIDDNPPASKPETTPIATAIGAVEEKMAKVMPETTPVSETAAATSAIADKPGESKPETAPVADAIGAVEEKTGQVMPETAPVGETVAAASEIVDKPGESKPETAPAAAAIGAVEEKAAKVMPETSAVGQAGVVRNDGLQPSFGKSAPMITDTGTPRDLKPEATPVSTAIGTVEKKMAKVMPETAPVGETAAAASEIADKLPVSKPETPQAPTAIGAVEEKTAKVMPETTPIAEPIAAVETPTVSKEKITGGEAEAKPEGKVETAQISKPEPAPAIEEKRIDSPPIPDPVSAPEGSSIPPTEPAQFAADMPAAKPAPKRKLAPIFRDDVYETSLVPPPSPEVAAARPSKPATPSVPDPIASVPDPVTRTPDPIATAPDPIPATPAPTRNPIAPPAIEPPAFPADTATPTVSRMKTQDGENAVIYSSWDAVPGRKNPKQSGAGAGNAAAGGSPQKTGFSEPPLTVDGIRAKPASNPEKPASAEQKKTDAETPAAPAQPEKPKFFSRIFGGNPAGKPAPAGSEKAPTKKKGLFGFGGVRGPGEEIPGDAESDELKLEEKEKAGADN